MKIGTPEAYRQALDKLNKLRDSGATADNNSEFAALEGAIAAYGVQADGPDQTKGRPAADSQGDT